MSELAGSVMPQVSTKNAPFHSQIPISCAHFNIIMHSILYAVNTYLATCLCLAA